MGSSIYGLTPLNLAIDGSLDQFYTLYKTAYDECLDNVVSNPTLLRNTDRLNDMLLAYILDEINTLASNNLKLFTDRVKEIYITRKHIKYFNFIDEEKVRRFNWRCEWEREFEEDFQQNYGHKSTLASQWHKDDPTGLSEFHETAIRFDQFIEEFQRIVTRAICEVIQEDESSYTIFDARRDVEDHIRHRMVNKRNACIIPTTSSLPPTKVPLYVFNALNSTSCKRSNHPIVAKKYYAQHTDGKNTVVLPVHYCTECDRYMIGSLSLSYFRDFCGKFIVQTHMLASDLDNSWDLVRESKLHQLGYNVIEGQLSSLERQNILVSLLRGKYITFFEMVSSIEQNIRMFRNHYKMQRAVQKWQDDLKFINEHMANNHTD